MGWQLTVAIFIFTLVASYLLRPRVATPKPERFQPPTAEEGSPVPVIFGTWKVAPNVCWYGDVSTKKVKKNVRFAPDQFLGYDYRAGMFLPLCHGSADELADIQFEDRSLNATSRVLYTLFDDYPITQDEPVVSPALPIAYTAAGVTLQVFAPVLFGGDNREGGVEGAIRFYFGSTTQGQDPYLAAQIGADRVSHYKRLCYAVAEKFTWGMTPYPKPIYFVLRRFPNLLGDATKININGDANPAEVLYEIAVNTRWAARVGAAGIDLPSFQAAAATLHAEGLGISGEWRTQEAAEQRAEEILRHVDGAVYTDPLTGLLTLKLIRADYVVSALLEVNDRNAELQDFSRGAWHETANEIRATYGARVDATLLVDGTNRVVPRFAPGSAVAPAQNLASIQATGEAFWETHDFPLFASGANGAYAAHRTLRSRSTPLARARLRVNREGFALHPGAAFRFSWPDSDTIPGGIEELVMRVVSFNQGELPRGKIEITAVQDVFDSSGIAYTAPPNPPEPPISNPLPVTAQRIVEAPYFHVGADRAVYVLAARRDGSHSAYDLWVNEAAAGYAFETQSSEWSPVGTLESPYLATTPATDEAGFVLVDVQDLDGVPSTDATGLLEGRVMCMVGDEVLSVRQIASLGGGRYRVQGVLRGQLDTVPLDHAAGAAVYFYQPMGAQRTSQDAYGADLSVAAKVLPINPVGQVALADATEIALVTDSRALKPYPPGNVRLGGLGYDAWPANVVGDAELTWSHRNRVAQTALVAQDAVGAYAIEGTLTIEVLIGGVVISGRTQAGVSGTTFTYTLAQRQADDADLNKPVQFRITPVSNGRQGTPRTTPPFTMSEA